MNGRICWKAGRAGSTFKFTVLLELSEGQFAEKQGGEKDPPFRPAGRARRILLAEDNPVNAVFAERVLTSAGHAVVRASSGQEALDILLGKGPFDLVLMDVQMPGMDGLEAVKRIREGEQQGEERLPVAALTAYALGEDRDLCLAAGMDDCITKPVSRDALLAAVERLTSRGGEGEG